MARSNRLHVLPDAELAVEVRVRHPQPPPRLAAVQVNVGSLADQPVSLVVQRLWRLGREAWVPWVPWANIGQQAPGTVVAVQPRLFTTARRRAIDEGRRRSRHPVASLAGLGRRERYQMSMRPPLTGSFRAMLSAEPGL